MLLTIDSLISDFFQLISLSCHHLLVLLFQVFYISQFFSFMSLPALHWLMVGGFGDAGLCWYKRKFSRVLHFTVRVHSWPVIWRPGNFELWVCESSNFLCKRGLCSFFCMRNSNNTQSKRHNSWGLPVLHTWMLSSALHFLVYQP